MFHSPTAVKFRYPAEPVSPVLPTQFLLRVRRASDHSVVSQSGRPLPPLDPEGYYVVTSFAPMGITFEDGTPSVFGVSFVSLDGTGPEMESDQFTPGMVAEPPDAPSEVIVLLD